MKQNTIKNYFSSADPKRPGKIAAGSSGCTIKFQGPRAFDGGKKSGKESAVDIFRNLSNPYVIYEKIREREKRQMRLAADPTQMESEMSSQNSTQLLLNSQMMDGSQSFPGNSSHSDDSAALYQQWIHMPPSSGLYGSQQPEPKSMGMKKNSTRPSIFTKNHSKDFTQCMENARRKSKEKVERDMLNNFLTLVKEYCDEAKTAVGKLDERYDEHSKASLGKFNEIARRFSGIQELLEGKREQAEKVINLEKKLQEVTDENQSLKQQLEDAKFEADNKALERLAETFDKGQQLQSDKMEELVLNTSDIKSFLEKPKVYTADMWCQYSPQVSKATEPFPYPARSNAPIGIVGTMSGTSAIYGEVIPHGGTKEISVTANPKSSYSTLMPRNPNFSSPASYPTTLRNQRMTIGQAFDRPSTSQITRPVVRQAHPLQWIPQNQPIPSDRGCHLPQTRCDSDFEANPASISSGIAMEPYAFSEVNAPSADIAAPRFQICNIGANRHLWSKSTNSPIAAVRPQQRLIKGSSPQSTPADTFLKQADPHQEELTKLCENLENEQSSVWFERPNTRSRRTATFVDAGPSALSVAPRLSPDTSDTSSVEPRLTLPPKKKSKRIRWTTTRKKKQPQKAVKTPAMGSTSFLPITANDFRPRRQHPGLSLKREMTEDAGCYFRAPSSSMWINDSEEESSCCDENFGLSFHKENLPPSSSATARDSIGAIDWFD